MPKDSVKVRYAPPPRYPFPRLRARLWRLNPARRIKFAAQRGAYEGNRYWLYVALGLAVMRVVRNAVRKSPTLVATEVLRPGESVVLRALVPEGRRKR